MGLYESYLITLGIIGSATAITQALKIPELVRSRYQENLEYVLGTCGTNQVKRKISQETGIAARNIHFRALETQSGSTQARGGFTIQYQVLLNDTEWMTLYWKQDKAAIDGTIRTHQRRHDRPLPPQVTETELSAFVQQYLRSRDGFDFIPQVYATVPNCGNLSEGLEGKTLATILDSQSPLQVRQKYYVKVLNRATLVTQKLSQSAKIRNIVERTRSSEITLGRVQQTRSYLRKKGINPAVANALGIGVETDQIIQRDLHPGNIIENQQQGMCFVDLSPDIGQWYDQAYALQHELGLIGDEKTERDIDDYLDQGLGQRESKMRGKLRYHLTQLMRTEKHHERTQSNRLKKVLDKYAAYHAHTIQELLQQTDLHEELKTPLENLARGILGDSIGGELQREYGRYLGSQHPFEQVNRENDSPSISIQEYREQIQEMRRDIAQDLGMARLSAFTAGTFGAISPLVDHSLLHSPSYFGIMTSLAVAYGITEASTKLRERRPTETLENLGRIVQMPSKDKR